MTSPGTHLFLPLETTPSNVNSPEQVLRKLTDWSTVAALRTEKLSTYHVAKNANSIPDDTGVGK